MSDAASNHSHPALLSARLAVPDFVMKCIEVRAVQCFNVQKSGIHEGVFHYCNFEREAADDAQNVRIDKAHGKDNNQQNPSKVM